MDQSHKFTQLSHKLLKVIFALFLVDSSIQPTDWEVLL